MIDTMTNALIPICIITSMFNLAALAFFISATVITRREEAKLRAMTAELEEVTARMNAAVERNYAAIAGRRS